MPAPTPTRLRRIGQFIVFSLGLKALFFAAAYFLTANANLAIL